MRLDRTLQEVGLPQINDLVMRNLRFACAGGEVEGVVCGVSYDDERLCLSTHTLYFRGRRIVAFVLKYCDAGWSLLLDDGSLWPGRLFDGKREISGVCSSLSEQVS